MAKASRSHGGRIGSILLKALLLFATASAALVLALRWLPVPISGVMIEKIYTTHESNDYRLRYTWVPAEQISPHIKIAVIAAEDQCFQEHFGFDFTAMADAYAGYRDGEKLRGASTITQQTAKNVFLWTGRSWLRKGLEAWFTLLLELLWPKQRILETYLNIAEFGPGVFGVEAAAQAYFGKPALRLTPREAALLAAALPNPLRLRVDRPSDYVLARQSWILDQMRRLGGTAYLRQFGLGQYPHQHGIDPIM